MAILSNRKIIFPLLIAALLLAETPMETVEARSKAQPAVSWQPLRRQAPKPSLRLPSSEPSAIFLPPSSSPESAIRPFSRGMEWQDNHSKLPELIRNPTKASPGSQDNRLQADALDQLSPSSLFTPEPMYQLSPLPTSGGAALPPPITGAQPQGLLPSVAAAAAAPSSETLFQLPPELNLRIKQLDFSDQDVRVALKNCAQLINLNIMFDQGVTGNVSILFNDVTLEEVMRILIQSANLAFAWEGNILKITTAANTPLKRQVFNILNTSAALIKPIIDRILTAPRETSEVDVRLNAILVTAPARVMAEVAELLPKIDVKESAVEVVARPTTEVFYLDYIDATAISAMILQIAPTATLQPYSSSSSQAGAAGGGATGRMDMMIITDTPNNLSRIRELIEKLDLAPTQVTIDAHIYEINLNEEERLGINWQKSIPIPGSTENQFSATIAPEEATAGGTGVFRFGSLSVNQFQALLAMLKTHTFAKVLSNPVITTLNNRAANITVGTSIPYVSSSQVNAATGNVTTTVSVVQANITLNVTPSVTGNDEVFLNITPTISSVLGFTTLGGNSTPNTSNRTAQTQVIVKNNHTIVIGGMIKTDKSDTISKVPFLGDLPGIGRLFQKKTQSETRTELIIFITPHIVRSQGKTPMANMGNEIKSPSPKLTVQK